MRRRPFGRLLDAEAEQLGSASVQAFETEGLIGAGGGARRAHLSVPPHRGPPRRPADACSSSTRAGWSSTIRPSPQQLREWLKTLRKKNASVVFATQSLSDIDGSNIAPAIVESCPTRIFLPNERAIEPQITAIYRRFGLNDRQIEILARATPKRDYYCQSRRGNRLFELGLGPVALAFCAASSKTDHAAIERVVAEHGREAFTPAWLADRELALGRRSHPRPDQPGDVIMIKLAPSGGGKRRRAHPGRRRAAGLGAVDRLRPDQLLRRTC